MLKENGFDKIRIKETLRYDYPSFGINIFWGDKNTYKGESQTMEMSGDDYEIYHRCRFYIDRILEEALREETRTIQVVPDGRLLDKMQGIFQLNSAGSLYWYCYYNAKYISPNDSDQKNEFPNQLTMLPGYTTLNIYWKSDPHHEFARPQYVIQVPHDKDYERMYINVEGEKLTWRFE